MAEVDTLVVLDGNGESREVPTILSLETRVGEVQATPTTNTVLGRLKAITDKIISAPATEAKQDAAAVLLQGIIDAIGDIPGGGGGGGDASAANQETIIAALSTLAGHVDGLEGALTTLNGKDFATQVTLAAVLAKLSADPATQTTSAAILAKITASAATEAKQDTLNTLITTQNGYLDGVEGTLTSLLAKVIAAPATEAKQDTLNTLVTTQNGYLDGIETLIGTTNSTLTTIDGRVDTLEAAIGATNETAATADTGTFGLNALIKRQLAKMTSALVAQLGARTVAQSPAVNIATDDPQIGTKVTAITALATGGSGIIGWLSQIWNELQARLPASLGPKARTSALAVTVADLGAGEYETVAASQTAQTIGATGATGDYISHLLVIPESTSPGAVALLDNATSITVFAGGADSVGSLLPFTIPLAMISASGAWKVTTGANVHVIAVGNFT